MGVPYKIEQIGKKYQILETPTNQVVVLHKKQEDAKNHAKILNRGGGFDGFTPKFMCVS